MSFTKVVEQRAYDHLYDPVFTAPSTGIYRNESNPAVKASAQPGNIVSGTSRHKYFKKPLVPHLHAVAPSVLLAPTAKVDPMVRVVDDEGETVKDVGVQTKYRDSEVQTNPYTPEFHVSEDNESPEVLELQGLSHSNGLPVGIRTVTMIERARDKRAMEASLPPITDEASLEIRKKIMEQQELREFKIREKEFDQMREKRLEVLRRAIDERDAGNEFLAEQRVEALRQRRMEDRDKAIGKIQQRRIKVLRKLTKSRANLSLPGGFNSHKLRDIITEYDDFSSNVYAPIRREGQAVDKDGDRFDVLSKTAPLNNVEAITNMEATIPKKLTKTTVKKPQQKANLAKTAADRKFLALTADLQMMDTIIKQKIFGESGNDQINSDEAASMPSWRKVKVKAERPTTPEVPEIDMEEEDRVLAVLLLQKLLRGRAVQNTMFEGKERRIELIRELRAADGEDEEEEDAIRPNTAERRQKVHVSAVDSIAGEVTAGMLDFLSKDLVRKEEKDKLQAFAKKADDERRTREIEESGRRQAEELVRSREDEAYRQIMRMCHSTAKTFVEMLMDQALMKIISDATTGGIRGVIGGAVGEAMGQADANVRNVSKNLVAGLMEPSAEFISQEAEKRKAQERHSLVAHTLVEGVMQDVTKNSNL